MRLGAGRRPHRPRTQSAGATRTRSSAHRRSSPSPTAWAAPRRARSPRASPPRHSASSTRRTSSTRRHGSGRSSRRRTAASTPGPRATRTRRAWARRSRPRWSRGSDRGRPCRRLARLPASDGALEQLTEDHSLVADLVRSGRLTPGGGRGPPAALGDHPRARHRPGRRRRQLLGRGPRRRRLPPLLGRAHDDARRGDRAAHGDARARASRGRARSRGRGERERRRGQHHRRPLRASPRRATDEDTLSGLEGSRIQPPDAAAGVRCARRGERQHRPSSSSGAGSQRKARLPPPKRRAGRLVAVVAGSFSLSSPGSRRSRSGASRGRTSSAPTRSGRSPSTRAFPGMLSGG